MFIEINETKLHYVIEGNGMPIIILHGRSVDYRLMYGCLEPCFQENDKYKRIYFDLPGMGCSVPSSNIKTWSDIRDILVRAIDSLVGDEEFLMIGESFGAHILRGILSKKAKQVLGVAFICPQIYNIEQTLPDREIIIQDKKFLASLDKEEYESFCNVAVVATKETYDKYVKDILSGIKLYDGKYIDELDSDLEIAVDQIYSGPSLFIMGKQDHWVGYEAAFRILPTYPRATYSILDCCGHNAQIERTEVFQSLIIDWLERVNLAVKLPELI